MRERECALDRERSLASWYRTQRLFVAAFDALADDFQIQCFSRIGVNVACRTQCPWASTHAQSQYAIAFHQFDIVVGHDIFHALLQLPHPQSQHAGCTQVGVFMVIGGHSREQAINVSGHFSLFFMANQGGVVGQAT